MGEEYDVSVALKVGAAGLAWGPLGIALLVVVSVATLVAFVVLTFWICQAYHKVEEEDRRLAYADAAIVADEESPYIPLLDPEEQSSPENQEEMNVDGEAIANSLLSGPASRSLDVPGAVREDAGALTDSVQAPLLINKSRASFLSPEPQGFGGTMMNKAKRSWLPSFFSPGGRTKEAQHPQENRNSEESTLVVVENGAEEGNNSFGEDLEAIMSMETDTLNSTMVSALSDDDQIDVDMKQSSQKLDDELMTKTSMVVSSFLSPQPKELCQQQKQQGSFGRNDRAEVLPVTPHIPRSLETNNSISPNVSPLATLASPINRIHLKQEQVQPDASATPAVELALHFPATPAATRENLQLTAKAIRGMVWFQSKWRSFDLRRDFLVLKSAASFIQIQWRSSRSRRMEHAAATKIGHAFLCHYHRLQYLRVLRATTIAQSQLRASRQRQFYLLKRLAVTRIQSRFKEYLAHRNLSRAALTIQSKWRYKQSKRLNAAIGIEARWRCFRERNRFLLLRKNTVLIQNQWQATHHSKQQRRSFLALRAAAVLIQSQWRAAMARIKAVTPAPSRCQRNISQTSSPRTVASCQASMPDPMLSYSLNRPGLKHLKPDLEYTSDVVLALEEKSTQLPSSCNRHGADLGKDPRRLEEKKDHQEDCNFSGSQGFESYLTHQGEENTNNDVVEATAKVKTFADFQHCIVEDPQEGDLGGADVTKGCLEKDKPEFPGPRLSGDQDDIQPLPGNLQSRARYMELIPPQTVFDSAACLRRKLVRQKRDCGSSSSIHTMFSISNATLPEFTRASSGPTIGKADLGSTSASGSNIYGRPERDNVIAELSKKRLQFQTISKARAKATSNRQSSNAVDDDPIKKGTVSFGNTEEHFSSSRLSRFRQKRQSPRKTKSALQPGVAPTHISATTVNDINVFNAAFCAPVGTQFSKSNPLNPESQGPPNPFGTPGTYPKPAASGPAFVFGAAPTHSSATTGNNINVFDAAFCAPVGAQFSKGNPPNPEPQSPPNPFGTPGTYPKPAASGPAFVFGAAPTHSSATTGTDINVFDAASCAPVGTQFSKCNPLDPEPQSPPNPFGTPGTY